MHPGGLVLSRELAEKLGLSENDYVLDVASGLGETAGYLSAEFRCRVQGLELSRDLAREAAAKFDGTHLGFANGDAELLPFKDETFTVVVSECSMCLIADLPKGLGEAFRVLRKGGRLGITDLSAGKEIDAELERVLLQTLCLCNKTTSMEITELVEETGFEQVDFSDQTQSMRALLETVRKRLLLAEILAGIGKLSLPNDQLLRAKQLLTSAEKAVDRGTLGYFQLTAQKP